MVVWDPKNPQKATRYAITWHVKRTGFLPAEIILPQSFQAKDAEAKALASEMKGLGIAIQVDAATDGIVCKDLGRPMKLYQLPWSPLYHERETP